MTYIEKVIEAFDVVHDFLQEQDEEYFLLVKKSLTLQALRLHKELAGDIRREESGLNQYVLTDGQEVWQIKEMNEDSLAIQKQLAEELTDGNWSWMLRSEFESNQSKLELASQKI